MDSLHVNVKRLRHPKCGCEACVVLLLMGSPCFGAEQSMGVLGISEIWSEEGEPNRAAPSTASTQRETGGSTEAVKDGLPVRAPAGGDFLRRKSAASPDGVSGVTPWHRTTLGSLGIVLFVIALLAWFVGRFAPRGKWLDGGKTMQIVGRTALDGRHSLALVQVGRRFVMLGVSADRVASLAQFTDEEEVLELAAQAGVAIGSGRGEFSELLTQEVRSFRVASAGDEGELSVTSPPGLRALLSRLEGRLGRNSGQAGG